MTVSADIVVYLEWIHKLKIVHPVYTQVSYVKKLFYYRNVETIQNRECSNKPSGTHWLTSTIITSLPSLFLQYIPLRDSLQDKGVISDVYLNYFLLNLRTLKAYICFLCLHRVICLKKGNHVVSAEEESTLLFQFPIMMESQESWYEIPVKVSDSYCFPLHITPN